MGGQQFCSGGVLVDMCGLDDVVSFDRDMGTILVRAGIEWPALIEYLGARPGTDGVPWAIRQKQTGADRLSIGGALAANAHGRGLTFPPFVSDVESFTSSTPTASLSAVVATRTPSCSPSWRADTGSLDAWST